MLSQVHPNIYLALFAISFALIPFAAYSFVKHTSIFREIYTLHNIMWSIACLAGIASVIYLGSISDKNISIERFVNWMFIGAIAFFGGLIIEHIINNVFPDDR